MCRLASRALKSSLLSAPAATSQTLSIQIAQRPYRLPPSLRFIQAFRNQSQSIPAYVVMPTATMSTSSQASQSSQLTSPDPRALPVLSELIHRDATSHHIEYRDYLSNHLVHHLGALYFLGADAERLHQCYDKHEELEGPKGEDARVGRENWMIWLGKKSNYAGLLAHFQRELSEHSLTDILKTYLPPLIPGLHGAALHPLIHLGYACEIGDNLNAFAQALSYCVFAHLPVLPPTHVAEEPSVAKHAEQGENGDADADPVSSLFSVLEKARNDDRLSEEKLFGPVGEGRKRGFQKKLHALLEKGAGVIEEYAGIWHIDTQDYQRSLRALSVAVAALASITSSRHQEPTSFSPPSIDFFLLHLLTSTHALHCILRHPGVNPLLPDVATQLLRHQYLNILAVFITQGRPKVPVKEDGMIEGMDATTTSTGWCSIVAAALKTNDEHATKGVHTLVRWWEWATKGLPAEKAGECESARQVFQKDDRKLVLAAAQRLVTCVAEPEMKDGTDNWSYNGVGW